MTPLLLLIVAVLILIAYGFWWLPRQACREANESLKSFAYAVELRFPSVGKSTERIVFLCLSLGKRIGLTRDQLHRLEMAARLRNVGLCSLPYQMGNSDPSEWSEQEWDTYRRHPELSGAMLELIPMLQPVANIVRQHHSPFDGVGNPEFLCGENLPIESRILAVVDAYVERTSAQNMKQARDYIEEEAGRRLDPNLVLHFCEMIQNKRITHALVQVEQTSQEPVGTSRL